MEIIYHILAGLGVGFAVGLTGIGGGSLMTPLLIDGFRIAPAIAVGTDLLYAAITKCSGVYVHKKRKTVEWSIVILLIVGSIPAAVLTVLYLRQAALPEEQLNWMLTKFLGGALIITAVMIFVRGKLQAWVKSKRKRELSDRGKKIRAIATVILGMVIGVLVTLSSVGAGVLGTTVLLLLYPTLPAVRVVGTELALAVPLTFVAGMGHLQMGHVDYQLLIGLLIGSLPGVYFGSQLGANISDKILRPVLATVLFVIGSRMLIVA